MGKQLKVKMRVAHSYAPDIIVEWVGHLKQGREGKRREGKGMPGALKIGNARVKYPFSPLRQGSPEKKNIGKGRGMVFFFLGYPVEWAQCATVTRKCMLRRNY